MTEFGAGPVVGTNYPRRLPWRRAPDTDDRPRPQCGEAIEGPIAETLWQDLPATDVPQAGRRSGGLPEHLSTPRIDGHAGVNWPWNASGIG